MKLASGHLSYCTNIHSGESWKDHFAALKENFPGIREQVCGNQAMGIGLRLSNSASMDIQAAEELKEFKEWLAANNAYVFTMNGFPYGNFHHAVVKDKVHAPDWTSKERVDYTIRLFNTLAKLLPEGMEGGISTSPLSYRFWFPDKDDFQNAILIATKNIIGIAEELIRIRNNTGVKMHLDIEPEPDGILESAAEFIDWFENVLIPISKQILPDRLNISPEEAELLIKEHICLCYDVCHFAIGYEAHREVIELLDSKGIRVGKIQISAALKADLPFNPELRSDIAEAFENYNEPTYLHQVVARKEDGDYLRYRDLPEALSDYTNPLVREWRAHFHVPVFIRDLGLLKSSQEDIIEVLKIQMNKPFTDHMEVETYTWEVLPDALKAPIGESIVRELNWVRELLDQDKGHE
ncbi:MAG: metabolite traffic protein EboE [Daejeonella sp.]|uniref:metabolite traffic protein EboE n=1 Tax=Daejeonella sp. TaxID=2805397 RepID=UPI002734E619|nr:metabolite traffic protein EboE [Daejeonella sp.]MDP3469705.1 metabolite traffic protein EboE [Daejeonella sp.]